MKLINERWRFYGQTTSGNVGKPMIFCLPAGCFSEICGLHHEHGGGYRNKGTDQSIFPHAPRAAAGGPFSGAKYGSDLFARVFGPQRFVSIHETATERGFTICINDSYGDCIDVLGKGGTKGDEGKTVYALTGPDFDGELPEGVEQEKIPTNYAYLLVRAKIADIESKEEIAEICMLQDAMDLSSAFQLSKKLRGTKRSLRSGA